MTQAHDQGPGGHAGHAHGVSVDADRGKLTLALALIVGFMIFEVVVGALVHSLALLSDAAHMLTDAGTIALSLVAIHLAAKPAKSAMTYGYKRAEILSAQFNGAKGASASPTIRWEWAGIRRCFGTLALSIAHSST
jgi:cobalt-zinc-cadmium efflux system protein